jgi:hypothetical protein
LYCLAAAEGQDDTKIAAALLMHREQRFRLSYVLGELSAEENGDQDDFSFEPASGGADLDEAELVSDEQRAANSERIADYVDRIKALTADVAVQTAEDFGPFAAQEDSEDKTAWLELFSDQLFESEGFAKLALDIKDDIEDRFDVLLVDELKRSETGWPRVWNSESDDRDEFLGKIRWFTSNHFRQFGHLLTPLVDGIRVRGPLRPVRKELQVADKLVWLDGQGLGHTSESASSVSTKVTRRFSEVDIILLVDSAQQPMQAAPLALLRAAASAGYADKIAVAFTHFDQVKGDNLPTMTQKRAHVLASITSAIAGLRPTLGPSVAAALERQMEQNVVLLGGLDREIDAIPPGVIGEFRRLLQMLQSAAAPAAPVEAAPIYEIGGLELALRDAVDSFQRPWEARLGLAYRDGIRAEHHTRVRALSRRFANDWSDEYDTLRPASDLIGRLQEEISLWLDNPARWTRTPHDEEERTAALNPVRKAVFDGLHDLATQRLGQRHREDWQTAYKEKGRGSGLRRSGEIRRIYEESAPPISSAMKPLAREFLTEVVNIVQRGVEKSGGHFEVSKAAE